jgi:hypothetical protein
MITIVDKFKYKFNDFEQLSKPYLLPLFFEIQKTSLEIDIMSIYIRYNKQPVHFYAFTGLDKNHKLFFVVCENSVTDEDEQNINNDILIQELKNLPTTHNIF